MISQLRRKSYLPRQRNVCRSTKRSWWKSIKYERSSTLTSKACLICPSCLMFLQACHLFHQLETCSVFVEEWMWRVLNEEPYCCYCFSPVDPPVSFSCCIFLVPSTIIRKDPVLFGFSRRWFLPLLNLRGRWCRTVGHFSIFDAFVVQIMIIKKWMQIMNSVIFSVWNQWRSLVLIKINLEALSYRNYSAWSCYLAFQTIFN